MKKILSIAAVSMISLTAFSSHVFAGEVRSLQEWSKEAGHTISSEMRYPQSALRFGQEGSAIYQVTVNRQGKVIDADLVNNEVGGVLSLASKAAIRAAKFPSLPTSYTKDDMTFSVQLNYAIVNSPKEQKMLDRQNVEAERLAMKVKPMTASITILDGNS